MTATPGSDQHVIPRRWERPLRRGLAAVFLVSTATQLVAGFLPLERPSFAFSAVAFVGMVSPVSVLALFLAVRMVPSQDDERLDERLRAVRDRAHYYAYALVSAVVLTLLLVAAVRAQWFDRLPDAEAFRFWLLGTTMLVLGAPSAAMAWTEPVRPA